MSLWAMILVLSGLIIAFFMLMKDRRQQKADQESVYRLRQSALYEQIRPMLDYCRHWNIEQVRVERDRVTFTRVNPPGPMAEFIPEKHGLRPMLPSRTHALCLLLCEEFPDLSDAYKYHVRRYVIIRPNGKKDYGYVYTIRSPYKDSLISLLNRKMSMYQ